MLKMLTVRPRDADKRGKGQSRKSGVTEGAKWGVRIGVDHSITTVGRRSLTFADHYLCDVFVSSNLTSCFQNVTL